MILINPDHAKPINSAANTPIASALQPSRNPTRHVANQIGKPNSAAIGQPINSASSIKGIPTINPNGPAAMNAVSAAAITAVRDISVR